MGGGLGLCRPDQQPADRVALVEGIEQTPYLVAVPHVAPLEFRQCHVAAVDVVEDGGDLHVSLTKQMLESIAIDPAGDGWLTTYFQSSLPKKQRQLRLHRDSLL